MLPRGGGCKKLAKKKFLRIGVHDAYGAGRSKIAFFATLVAACSALGGSWGSPLGQGRHWGRPYRRRSRPPAEDAHTRRNRACPYSEEVTRGGLCSVTKINFVISLMLLIILQLFYI